MGILLNQRQERFCQLLFAGENGRPLPACKAYERAGYETTTPLATRVNASRLLAKANVESRLSELNEEVTKAGRLSRTTIRELLLKAYNDGDSRGQTAASVRAAELLGKDLGMFVDRHELGQPGAFRDLSDSELRSSLADEFRALGLPSLADRVLSGESLAEPLPLAAEPLPSRAAAVSAEPLPPRPLAARLPPGVAAEPLPGDD